MIPLLTLLTEMESEHYNIPCIYCNKKQLVDTKPTRRYHLRTSIIFKYLKCTNCNKIQCKNRTIKETQ